MLIFDALHGVLGEKFLLFFLAVDTSEEALHLNLARELHDTLDHSFGAGRTAGNENVDGYDVLDAFGHVVALAEGAALDGA